MSVAIVSSVPGRARLRLRARGQLAAAQRLAQSWPEVLAAEDNPRTGSLLLHYDATRIGRAAMEARLQEVFGIAASAAPAVTAAAATAVMAEAPPSLPAHASGAPRVRANRWAKRGMLASLGVSLVLAALGAKRWHALTGIAFMHALGVHLWVHRRHLLR